MKRALLWSVALSGAFTLTGCPIYPDEDIGCFSDSDCGNEYYCDYPSGACVLRDDSQQDFCGAPADCPVNYTCGVNRTCQPGSCYSHGCVAGFTCESASGRWSCVRDVPDERDAGAGPVDSGTELDATPVDAS